jgi:hypothetical protein
MPMDQQSVLAYRESRPDSPRPHQLKWSRMRFHTSPLLDRDRGSLFEGQSARVKVLSRMNMGPSFEDSLL